MGRKASKERVRNEKGKCIVDMSWASTLKFEEYAEDIKNGYWTPKMEVRYENLTVEGDVNVGSRALPTLINLYLNNIETQLEGKKESSQGELMLFFLWQG
ncbi:hypothetical protein Dsin_006632 [Dipteronia sinensis]|uniref:Pleiotropic ABC efflux transporter N-terminal domain-containing protein n=1 Tax=Dipteronia sinensis TaxID=43782 RepID=A0AAE0AZY9_9ROSI|nr:hypothetical protein Dsin_006632 [Dipteronia sinensis]